MNSMSDKFFVDTNILLYALDETTGEKHQVARRLLENLWRERSGILSTQVLQELCVSSQRRAGDPLSLETLREIVEDYLAWEVVVNTRESVLAALDMAARYKVSFWDALILQAAHHGGAEVLYSEDLAHGQTYETVRVVNPFHD
jgi:predicted nucleic acid-binding protein